MNSKPCAICHCREAFIESQGMLFVGHYGSTKFDLSILIKLRDDPEFETGEMLCDGCVDLFVAQGYAEPVHSVVDVSLGQSPSQKALERMFLLGSREVMQHMQVMESASTSVAGGVTKILEVRRTICPDGFAPGVYRTDAPVTALHAKQVGAAHAAAAYLCGGSCDPEGPAAEYAEAVFSNREQANSFIGHLFKIPGQ